MTVGSRGSNTMQTRHLDLGSCQPQQKAGSCPGRYHPSAPARPPASQCAHDPLSLQCRAPDRKASSADAPSTAADIYQHQDGVEGLVDGVGAVGVEVRCAGQGGGEASRLPLWNGVCETDPQISQICASMPSGSRQGLPCTEHDPSRGAPSRRTNNWPMSLAYVAWGNHPT